MSEISEHIMSMRVAKFEIDCLKRDLSEITTANTVIRYERDDALAEISRLKEEVTRLRQYEDAITAAKDGVLVVWNLMDTNSTVIANDYWQSHLEEIDRLKAELEEANNTIIAHANTISRVEEANVHLQDQLAKAKKEAQNYKNVLIGQGFENLDALAYETRDTTQIGAIAKQRTEQIIAQLAEARAENERLNSVDHYACALCPDVAQARQEAAREILTEIEKYYVGGKHDYYHITTEDLIGMIKAKFRLEG